MRNKLSRLTFIRFGQAMSQTWSHDDFNELDWCNSKIHGIAFGCAAEKTGSVSFDIDYVLAWDKPQPDSPNYRVASASLVFRDVSNLQISINCLKMHDGSKNQPSHPIRISSIDRKSCPPDDTMNSWLISFYDMEGDIRFESTGFQQTLTSEIVNCHSKINRIAG